MKPLSELPGWVEDDHIRALAAFRSGCRVAREATLRRACMAADRTDPADEDGARRFFEHHFRAQTVPGDGVLTGYFAPVYPASRVRSGPFTAPVRAPPPASTLIYRRLPDRVVAYSVSGEAGDSRAPPPLDLERLAHPPIRPVATPDPVGDLLAQAPAQAATDPQNPDAGGAGAPKAAGMTAPPMMAAAPPDPAEGTGLSQLSPTNSPLPLPPVRMREAERALIDTAPADDALAWMRPEDLFFMQIQGSGVLYFPDGARLRAAYAGDNGQPFVGIAKVMLQQRLLPNSGTSGDAIRGWLADHAGEEAQAVMNRNPRYVFFRLGSDNGAEPMGAAGIPLPAGRAIAMDSSHHQFGTPYWIDAEAPVLHGAASRYRRLAVALDTGGAIRGEVRADLYFGTGDAAGAEAGRVRHRLHLTRLVPVDPEQEDAGGSTPPSPGRR